MSSLFFNLKKLFWPHPLGFYYGYNMIPPVTWKSPELILSILIHAGLLVFALILLRKKHILSFAILYYLAAVSIFTNFFLPVPGIVGERFLFSALLGFCIIIAYVILKIYNIKSGRRISVLKKILLVCTVLVFLVPMSYKTITRNKVWKNYDTLFSHDIEYLENSVKAQYTYANFLVSDLFDRYRSGERGSEFIEKANQLVFHFQKIIEIDSTYKFAWNNLGVLYSEILNRNMQSILCYEMALKYDTTYAEAWYNAGAAWLRESNFVGAKFSFEHAVMYDPSQVEDIADMADSYFNQRRYREALVLYPVIINMDSTLANPVRNLGFCHLISGDTLIAVTYLQKAFEMDPTNYGLGMDLYRYFSSTGNVTRADYYLTKANINRKE